VHRTDIGRDHVRLDTDNASYVAEYEAVYSVETTAPRSRDRVRRHAEVRTPSRSTRLREGESATVDDRGVFDLLGDQRSASDDFERWSSIAPALGTHTSISIAALRTGAMTSTITDAGSRDRRRLVVAPYAPSAGVRTTTAIGTTARMPRVSYDPWGWGTYHYGAGRSIRAWLVWCRATATARVGVLMYGPSYVG
jgi:hypothetical protein